ncbi:zinc knuckle, partial [Ostertagia ostertagi]
LDFTDKQSKLGKAPELRKIKNSPNCFYCDGKSHWPAECTKITDPKQHLEYLRYAKRCISCGSLRHSYAECKSQGCWTCGKKHHTSVCFRTSGSRTEPQKTKGVAKMKIPTRQNIALCEENGTPEENIRNSFEEEEAESNTALTAKQTKNCANTANDVFLLSGVFRVEHPRTRKPAYINVLFDTGADRSFIATALAEELDLPKGDSTSMKLTTFGAKQPKEIECTKTELKVWDAKGKQHNLQLYTHDILTVCQRQRILEEEDLKFIKKRRINLCNSSNSISGPAQVVLGCDQLWSFIDFEAPQFTLPSGLLLIPTRVGYIVSGKRLTREKLLSTESLSVCMAHTHDVMDPSESDWLQKNEWLNTPPNRLNTGPYVSNRVKEVHRIAHEMETQQVRVQLGYVDTKHNPVDCATRGVTSSEFINHIWWKGYSLREIRDGNFVSTLFTIPNEDGEDEPTDGDAMLVESSASQELQVSEIMETSKYNSYAKVRRVMAYAMRFLKCIHYRLHGNLKERLKSSLPWIESASSTQYLTAQEIAEAETVLIRNHQQIHLRGQYRKELTSNLNLKTDEHRDDDDSYLPPTERARMQTRIEATRALQSSQALTEKYWAIWKDSYLTALRETHRRQIDQKHGCVMLPRTGELVLLTDPCKKRYQWKMARISKLISGSDGAVREAEVVCAKRVLRRPVNQLIPLEIEGNYASEISQDETQGNRDTTSSTNNRYYLRPRHKQIRAVQEQSSSDTAMCYTTSCNKRSSRVWPIALYMKMALALLTITASFAQPTSTITESALDTSYEYQLECRANGVYLHAPKSSEYELCVNDHCIRERLPPIKKLHSLPAEEVLLDFEARWKLRFGNDIVTIEKLCPAQQFCSTIDCTVCSTNILNPECWPSSAILGLGVILYLLIALCYTIFYVPVTIGRPVQLLLRGFYRLAHFVLFIIGACLGIVLRRPNRRRYRNASRILEALAILYLCSTNHACQIVNIFSHHIKTCTTSSGRTTCAVDMA